jgi:hypothetical protein
VLVGVGGDEEAFRGQFHRQFIGEPLHFNRILDTGLLLRRIRERKQFTTSSDRILAGNYRQAGLVSVLTVTVKGFGPDPPG